MNKKNSVFDGVRQRNLQQVWKVLLGRVEQMEKYGFKHRESDIKYKYYQQVYSQILSIIKNSQLPLDCKPIRVLKLFEARAFTSKKYPDWNYAIKNLHLSALRNQRDTYGLN